MEWCKVKKILEIIYIYHNKCSLDTAEIYISSLNPDLGSTEMRVGSNFNIAEPKEPFVFWKTFILQLLTVFVKHDFPTSDSSCSSD